jgi:hypothetical protein
MIDVNFQPVLHTLAATRSHVLLLVVVHGAAAAVASCGYLRCKSLLCSCMQSADGHHLHQQKAEQKVVGGCSASGWMAMRCLCTA